MIKWYSGLNLFIYGNLFISTICINKYVLSVLKFTYPTIFQGWQTLVGGILLRILRSKRCIYEGSFTALDKEGVISLLPSFFFFTFGGIAGSKALAGLSISTFVSIQTSGDCIIFLADALSGLHSTALLRAIILCLLNMISAVTIIVMDLNMKFSESPHFWAVIHVVCQVVHMLHSKVADSRYNQMDKLYFSYIFSLLILAPASLYLEEAFEALHFQDAARFDFFFGCVSAGVFALFLKLFHEKVKTASTFKLGEALSRVLLCFLSEFAYGEKKPASMHVLFAVCVFSSGFVPASSTEDSAKSSLIDNSEEADLTSGLEFSDVK